MTSANRQGVADSGKLLDRMALSPSWTLECCSRTASRHITNSQASNADCEYDCHRRSCQCRCAGRFDDNARRYLFKQGVHLRNVDKSGTRMHHEPVLNEEISNELILC